MCLLSRWGLLCLCLGGLNASVVYAQNGIEQQEKKLTGLQTESVEATVRQYAQELNWSQIYDLIKKFNPDVLAVRAQIRAAQAGILTAEALPNPEFSFETGHLRQRTPDAIPGNTQTITISQPLENLAVRAARGQIARYAEKASQKFYLTVLNDVLAQGRARLYELVLREAELQSVRQALFLLEQVRDRVALRVKSGESPRFELVKADTEVLNAKQRVETARSLAARTRVDLEVLTGGAFPDQVILQAHLDDPVNMPNSLSDVENNPAVLQLDFELRKMRSKIEQEKAARWAGMTIKVSQSREPEVRAVSAGVVFNVPIFDQRQGPIAEAEAEVNRLRVKRDGLLIQLKQEVEFARQSLILAKRKVLALETGVLVEANTALKIAQTAYQFGERGLLDVLDAQRVLRTVQAELLMARYEVQLAGIQLNRLCGQYVESIKEVNE